MVHALQALAAEGRTGATLWVLETNTLAPTFYESGGWRSDGATQEEHVGNMSLREVRYRRALPDSPAPIMRGTLVGAEADLAFLLRSTSSPRMNPIQPPT